MRYFSTKRNSPSATFREAVLLGQPADGGLYFPSEVPRWSADFVADLASRSNADIAFEILRPFVGKDIPDAELSRICAETVNFPFPLVSITPDISALELFHGPTLAFKDVGARFMSRCMSFFSSDLSQKTIVIVATSGDTGGAVAAAFHGIEGIEVVIVYPKGRVSRVQELQLTTLGGNVTTLEVRGSFDDCQKLAKRALSDVAIQEKASLTSANSINIGRWLPQQIYYALAIKQWQHGEPPVFSVPSGNFGNIAAGLLAHASGLPAGKFIAACNANDVVPRFMKTGHFDPRESVSTLSSAMDVGDPSNFVRVLELFDADLMKLSDALSAVSVGDGATRAAIKQVHDEFGYSLDPHGAVGYLALADYLANHPGSRGIFLETAHPAKFGNYSVIPEALKALEGRPEYRIEMDADYAELRSVLLSKT